MLNQKKSKVWDYFEIDKLDQNVAKCKLYHDKPENASVLRGRKTKDSGYGTHNLKAHLKAHLSLI